MDAASVIGLTLSVLLLLGSILIGGAPLSIFIDVPSILVVFGGGAAATMMCFPMRHMTLLPKVLWKCLCNRSPDYRQVITEMVSLSETARRDGLLALDNRLEHIKNPFVRLGIQLAVDGSRPELVEDILKTEMAMSSSRHRDGKGTLDQYGRYTPAFGMIGTLLGLVMMLNNMSDPASIGAGMAVALLTTLYGAVAANSCFLPFAEKLAFMNKEELLEKEIIMRGVLAIQSGENPRVIEQKLLTFVPPDQRLPERRAA